MRNSQRKLLWIHVAGGATNYKWVWPSIFAEKTIADNPKTTKVSHYTVCTLMMTLLSSSSSGIMSPENCSHCCLMEVAMAVEKEEEGRSRSSQRTSANCSGVIIVSVGCEMWYDNLANYATINAIPHYPLSKHQWG